MSEPYEMGLRAPRCNGCDLARLKWELGDKFLVLYGSIYEMGATPSPGQGLKEWKGVSVKFRMWGMSYGHSDECYNWKPPAERKGRIT